MPLSAEVFARHPRRAITILAALSVIALLGWLDIQIPDLRSDGGTSNFEDILMDESGAGRPEDWSECLLVIDTKGGGSIFQRQHLEDLRAILKKVRALDDVQSATAIDSIPVFTGTGLPKPLLPGETASDEQIASARSAAETHPLAMGQLLSPDTTLTLVPLAVKRGGNMHKTILGITDDAAEIADGTGLRARLTGALPIQTAMQTTTIKEQFRFLAIGYAFVVVIALSIFRGWRAALVAMLPAVATVFFALGILFFFRQGISPLSQVITPVMLTMIAFTDSVHLLFQFRVDRAAGASQKDASASTMRRLTIPCALTSLTTAIGFGSLMIAESRIIRDFGFACALGVGLAFLSVITLSPVLQTSRLAKDAHRRVRPEPEDDAPMPPNVFVSFLIRHAKLVVIVAIVVVGVSGWAASDLRPDSRILTDMPESSEAYQALALCDEKLGGVQFVQIEIEAPADLPAKQLLEIIAEAQSILEAESLIGSPFSLRNLLEALPGTGELEERMPLLSLVPDDLAHMLHDGERSTVFGRVRDIGIARYQATFERMEREIGSLAESHPEFEFKLGGSPVWWGRFLHRMVMDLVKSLALAAVLIFIVMGFAHRSIRIGLISVLPNMIPLMLTAALLSIGGWGLEMVTVCAFTICLGIAVDDTVHFLWRFHSDYQRTRDRAASINSAFVHTGRVMLATTAIMVGGFATPLISDIAGFRAFGALACGTLVAALFADLVVLPALLWIFPVRRAVDSTTATDKPEAQA